jgi:hypothetical protein
MAILNPPGQNILNFLESIRNGGGQTIVSPKPEITQEKEMSFVYDPSSHPLKSTQQINIDWSRFENHTFFSSAEAKTGIAIDQIINKFPFDGSKDEVQTFFDNLTGFERWVFSQLPVNKGFVNFDSSTKIITKDRAGAANSSLSRDNSGDSIVNPRGNNFTIEFFIKPYNNSQEKTIFRKGSSDYISVLIVNIDDKSKISFKVLKGDFNKTIDLTVKRGEWSHVAFTWNNKDVGGKIIAYVNAIKEDEVLADQNNIVLDIDYDDIEIGGFAGELDEFRIFHEERTPKQIRTGLKRAIFSTPELKLYYKFNEPSGNLILDSSGNSLHSNLPLIGVTRKKLSVAGNENSLFNEQNELSVVLFPNNSDVIRTTEDLLERAIEYDKENPNLITKLIPEHYLQLGSDLDGTNDLLDAERKKNYSYSAPGNPGQYKLDSVQVMLSFLYIWSKFFDEMKIYLDSFSTLNTFNFEGEGSSPDNFLLDFIKRSGFFMTPLFTDSTLSQYVDGEDITENVSLGGFPLKKIQSEITRRIIIALPGIIKSKGTQESIKAFLRSVGINTENSVRIREYGGPTSTKLSHLRETKVEDIWFYKMTKGGAKIYFDLFKTKKDDPGVVDYFFLTPVLNDQTQKNKNWTFEGLFQWRSDPSVNGETLFKIKETDVPNTQKISVKAKDGILSAYLNNDTSPSVTLDLGLDFWEDEKQWKISFGLKDGNKLFLMAGTQDGGERISFKREESLLTIDTDLQVDTKYSLEMAQSSLSAFVSGIRLWKKALEEREFVEHIRNPKSVGVSNVKDDLQHLQFHFIGKQGEREIKTGWVLQFDDLSGNFCVGNVSGEDEGNNNFHIVPTIFSRLSPYFDEYTTSQKIRVRGYSNYNGVTDEDWIQPGPVYQIPPGEIPRDDNRLSIEFSLIDALNKDIVNIFSSFEEIEKAIGSPGYQFEPNYPDLEKMKDEYFKKISGKMNFAKFFEFFKWFDKSLGRFISQLIPRKTHFKGTNFVIESHMLERAKLQIESSGMYAGAGINSALYTGVI